MEQTGAHVGGAEVRQAYESDLDTIVEQTWQVAAEGRWTGTEVPFDRAARRERLASAVANDSAAILVACISGADGEVVVGHIWVSIAPYGVADIGMLVVDLARQRHRQIAARIGHTVGGERRGAQDGSRSMASQRSRHRALSECGLRRGGAQDASLPASQRGIMGLGAHGTSPRSTELTGAKRSRPLLLSRRNMGWPGCHVTAGPIGSTLVSPGTLQPGGQRLRSAAAGRAGTGSGGERSGWSRGSLAVAASTCRRPESPARSCRAGPEAPGPGARTGRR